jgi:hypothetical protein
MRRNACFMAVLAALFISGLHGQTTFATITGSVADPSGAAVPGATIVATHTTTNSQTTAQSNDAGIYTLGQLREGQYSVRAKAAGFKEFVATNVELVSRDYRRLDISLEVGGVETAVEVTAGATLIETETARIADTKTAEMLRSIPLNTRGIWAFLSLSPGVLQAGTGSTIRFAGSRSNQSHWAIDGITFSDGVDETAIGPLANYIESYQEIKLDISNNTAEFGTIGQVTLISKSGTNDFHGNLFDYYVTPWFRARNPFAPARNTGVNHTPGGSAGGPVYIPKLYNGKDKTFFFFSFETGRGSPSTVLLNPTVPLSPWRAGDFSALSTPIRDPFTGQPFPGNRIPANRLNQTALKLQERYYPLPNFGDPSTLVAQNYRENKIQPFAPSDYWTLRGDHRFNDKNAIYGRFTLQDVSLRAWQSNLPTVGQHFQHRYNRAFALSYTHSFTPTMINEARYGFGFNNNTIDAPFKGNQFVQEMGLVGLAPNLPDVGGLLKINWTGIGLQQVTSLDYRDPGFLNFLQEYQDHLSWFKGRHNMKFGVNLTRVVWDDGQAGPNLFGTLSFSNRYTGHPYADFLLGLPSTADRNFPFVEINRLRWQYDFFLQDDFKITPRLTLNLGVRYDYHPVWRERNGQTAMFDIGTGKIVIQDGSSKLVSPLFPRNYVDVVEASSVGLNSSTIINSDRNNIMPRIGLAWRPWGNNTVLRSGFGIFYDVVPRNLTQGGLPFVLNEPTFNNPADSPAIVLPRVFPETTGAGPSTVSLPAAVNPDLQIPYSMQYNFTLEHSQWDTGFRASYIGTNTRQGDWAYNINSPVPDSRPFVDKPRMFPNYPGINYYTNGAGHQYHSFTGEVERRFAQGLYLQGSWTWARDIGDLSRGEVSENPFDRERERAVWMDIPTHRLNFNWIYQLPFGKGKPFLTDAGRGLNLLVGGWEISGVYSYYSGQFLTPLWSGPDPTGTAFTTSRTPANVTNIRPDILRDPNLPADQRTVTRWFDTTAFVAPQPGQFGTSAKGVIKGPDVNVWHAGFFKTFVLGGERAPRLRWELTATNFFNHPNYNNPVTNITSTATLGTISGVGAVNGSSTGDQPGARSFRMGLRLDW